MQITFEGVAYDFDFNEIDVQQATVIKSHTGLAIAPWQRAIYEADPQALQALLWVMKQQHGDPHREPSTLRFKPSELIRALNDALTAEALGEPDPTKGNAKGKSSTRSTAPAGEPAE